MDVAFVASGVIAAQNVTRARCQCGQACDEPCIGQPIRRRFMLTTSCSGTSSILAILPNWQG